MDNKSTVQRFLERKAKKVEAQDIDDEVDRLEEIKEEIKSLMIEAQELVRATASTVGGRVIYDRAKSYWIGHILGALDEESGYLGGSMTTMQNTIDELRESVEGGGEEEEE